MSLVGNLEDLGLGEILQIVSLSRKSGVLALYSRGREGKIAFRSGQVVHATASSCQENLGEILVQKGVIDPQTLKKALSMHRDAGCTERLGSILTRVFGVPADVIEDIVRGQIEKVVYSLFAWAEGTFDFELQDNITTLDVTHLDPLQFMLDQGLNPQFLAMEGSRILDEMRHRGELEPDDSSSTPDEQISPPEENVDLAFDLLQAPDTGALEPAIAPPACPVATSESIVADSENRCMVITDDDSSTREALAGMFEKKGYEVFSFERTEDALIQIDILYREDRRPIVLVDLIMPRMDGSGIMGGLELLELIHTNFIDLPVVALADYQNSDAERNVSRMGYPLLIKPRKPGIADPELMQKFTGALLAELNRLEPTSSTVDVPGETINLGDELRLEMGEELAPAAEPREKSTGIALLRGILEELHNPSLGGGIILLVLRFASEFMNRAVIFIVKRDEIVGLGQFGILDGSGHADARVRTIRIPFNEDSLFQEIIQRQLAIKTNPQGSPWHTYLFNQLGGGTPREFFVGPIASEGKVVALLYGDNLPENRSIGDVDSLEIFLSQAGMAMEKALLQRRLKEKGQEGA